jgi:hypothetical protein
LFFLEKRTTKRIRKGTKKGTEKIITAKITKFNGMGCGAT